MLKYVPDAPLQVDLSARAIFNNKYWVGGAYRSEDAASIMLGIDLSENLNVAYAYDFILQLGPLLDTDVIRSYNIMHETKERTRNATVPLEWIKRG